MRSVAVFCGSRDGASPAYASLATALGHDIAARGLRLVYGGGKVGLMGILANAALGAGGEVTGVIPRDLMDKELGHSGVTRLVVTGSMHERKATMEREADGFIAIPGGFGTLDEFFEIVTWAQLGIHHKPVALLDTGDRFFRHLIALFDDLVESGFVQTSHRDMILRDSDPAALLDRMAAWHRTAPDKWDAPIRHVPEAAGE